MSLKGSPSEAKYTPSDTTDAIVLAVLACVCVFGIMLTAPAPDTSETEPLLVERDVESDAHTVIVPEPAPEDTAPGAEADSTVSGDDIVPPVPAIKPPPDIDLPSIKPDPAEADIAGIDLRDLPDLAPGDLIPSGAGFISLMGSHHDPTNWHRSTHAAGDDFQATDWSSDHAVYDADGLSLQLEHAAGQTNTFLGGEIQTRGTYGYGRYEVLMRPAKASGTVTSFFTYTGPYYGNPHDEVDIEFLGQDTTKVYLNYFRNGRVGDHVTLDLPFDAGEALHLYAFEWRPDSITWFVDGVPIHQTKPDDRNIPRTPAGIFVNLWSGKPKLRFWHGQPDFNGRVESEYACISFQPYGSDSRSCSTVFPPETARKPAQRRNILLRTAGDFLKRFTPRPTNTRQFN